MGAGESWDGQIVRVVDGDSLVLRLERGDVPVGRKTRKEIQCQRDR